MHTVMEGSLTPVEMLLGHAESVLEQQMAGDLELPPPPEFTFFEEEQVSAIYPVAGDWSVLSRRVEGTADGKMLRDLQMVLSGKDLYRSVLTSRPDTAWVYYLSPEGFVFSVPEFPLILSDNLERLYERQYWIEALPENNPEGLVRISDVYEDLGGKGWMVTLSRPVYAHGQFAGVICMDVSIDRLISSLQLGSSIGVSLLLDADRKVQAASDEISAGTPMELPKTELIPSFGKFSRTSDLYLMEIPLLDGELILHHTVPRTRVRLLALNDGLPLILTLLILNILVYLTIRLRHSLVMASSERDFSRRLLSIVSHDLQSPLSVTRQAADVLITENNRDAAELVRKSNNTALALLRDLSYWGKSRSQEIRLEPAPCSMAVVFQKVIDTLKMPSEIKDIEILTEVTVDIVVADTDVLTTVVRNLVSNAVKFSRPGSRVRLESKNGPGTSALISVIDEGAGMTDEQVRRLLQRRPLESRPGTRGEKGSGIGLSLVSGLCDNAEWPLSVSSELDKGTAFTITVPLE